MLATLGDLVDDVVVRLGGPINAAADTPSLITRRRGGSAANVASTAGLLGQPVRFIGQVGNDTVGTALIGDLTAAGVDTQFVGRQGTTGTIVVLVDGDGERSMLTDRRTCTELSDPIPEWLDGVATLHVPLYSLVGGMIAFTAATLIGWAHERGVAISIDLSSTSLMSATGLETTRSLVADLRPDVIFANSDEAALFGLVHFPTTSLAVVKDGPRAAMLRLPSPTSETSAATTLSIPPIDIDRALDTTGAGDAFAAGFLTFREWQDDPAEACLHGHRAAHRVLTDEGR